MDWLSVLNSIFRQTAPRYHDARGVHSDDGVTWDRIEPGDKQAQQRIEFRGRGSMEPIPTPQALIRQVTGIGKG